AKKGADLGLYSITFNNDLDRDYEALEAYKEFRIEAERKGFRHFLEVFSPNAPVNPIEDVPKFVSDHIARTLAGVTTAARPIFLKIPYYGPKAMEALVRYDSSLVVGIWEAARARRSTRSKCFTTRKNTARASRSMGARSTTPTISLPSLPI
ncbi:MAG: hypothetical protein II486_08040, partial [Thermoguttaceae bacterium]|nr:hypothetical protein [Thermoguttaceae bacterium]